MATAFGLTLATIVSFTIFLTAIKAICSVDMSPVYGAVGTWALNDAVAVANGDGESAPAHRRRAA